MHTQSQVVSSAQVAQISRSDTDGARNSFSSSSHGSHSIEKAPHASERHSSHSQDGSGSSIDVEKRPEGEGTKLQEATPAAPTFPEGGFEAWATVLGACFAVMVSFGLITSFGVFQSHYVEVLGRSNSDISWIGSMQTGFFYLVGALVGRLYDAFGPKRLTLAGTLLLSFGLMMTSLAERYYQLLLAQGLVTGLGSALVFYPALLSVPSYFLRLRGLAVGIVVAGAALGGTIWPIALQRMFDDRSLGFAWTVRIFGFLVLAVGLAATALVSTRAPSRKHGAFFEREAWSDPKYTGTVIGAAFSTLGFFVPYFYIETFAIMKGVSTSVAFYGVTAVNGGSLLGRLLSAVISDKFGKYNTLTVASFASTAICLAVWLPINVASLSINQALAASMSFAVVFGVANGAFFSASLPALASFTPLTHLGLRAGMLYTILTIPALIGTPISGALLSTTDESHFTNLIIWSSVTQFVGFLAFAFVRYRISSSLRQIV